MQMIVDYLELHWRSVIILLPCIYEWLIPKNCSSASLGQLKTCKMDMFHLFCRYLGIIHLQQIVVRIPKATSKWTYILLQYPEKPSFSFSKPNNDIDYRVLAHLDCLSQNGSRTTNRSWKQNQTRYCKDYFKLKKQWSIKRKTWMIKVSFM